MDFSKYKLQQYLSEGQVVEKGAQASISTSMNSSINAKDGSSSATEEQTGNKTRQRNQSSQATGPSQKSNVRYEQSVEYNKNLLKEKEIIKAVESQRSDWRTELQEKVVDGKEREQHPFVTVMPTGDENLIQAVEQMAKAGKKKKDAVTEETEEVEDIQEEKKCKEGYKYDSDKKKCVKKKKKKKSSSKKTTFIMGRGIYGGGMHHHHHDDDNDGDNEGDGGEAGGSGGDGGGGGMGEMFDILGDMLIQEMNLRDAQKAGMTKGAPKKPVDHAKLNRQRVADYVPPKTTDKDRAK